MNDALSKLFSRLQEVWKGLNLRQRITIIGTALFVVLALGVVTSSVARKPDYVPLYPKLEPQDAQDIVTKLTSKKIPFKPSDDGSTILVQAKNLYAARWSLASDGLPKGGSTGYELFDKSKIGSTDFERRVNYVRALQGELERTFRQIEEVEQAKVLIVLPEESLFVTQQKPATASVLLKTRSGAKLDGKQVRGIVQLVSHSVEGLKPEAVTVVDTHGRILSADVEEEAKGQTADRQTATRMEIQKNFQRDLEKSVQSLLEQVLGPGNVAARVTAELNFDDKTVENRLFQPVADGQGIIRSMQQLEKTMKGTEAPPPQPTGSQSNIPGYTGTTQTGGTSESSERSVTRNYEINEVKEQIRIAPGAVKRLSVGVVVNRELTAQLETAIRDTVAGAIGLVQDPKSGRNDLIKVTGLAFNSDWATQIRTEMEQEKKSRDALTRNIYIGVAAAVALVLALTFARRRRAEVFSDVVMQPEGAALFAAMPEVRDEPKPKERDLTPEEKERQKIREEIEKLARTKPQDVAALIKSWINEE